MGRTAVKEIVIKSGKARRQKGGGAKKIGRSKAKCAKYRAAGTREKNKKRNIAKAAKFKAKKKAEKEGAK